jgi:uncharacterized integral membrane protein
MSDHQAPAPQTGDGGGAVRWIIAALIVAATVVVAVDNREEVSVGYVFGDASAPVWVILVAAGIAGIVVGWLVKHRPRHHD